MHIVSVNTGRPRPVRDGDDSVATGIWKEQREGAVRIGWLNLEGDGQADLVNHGGRDKAVYAYAAEHYAAWSEELPEADWPWGAFGENLTLRGLDIEALGIGDELRVGTARMKVTMPRIPCFKLGLRLGRPDAARRMARNGRCGSYLRVLEEGTVQAGDAVELVGRGEHGITVGQLFALAMRDVRDDGAGDEEETRLLRIAAALPTLPENVRARYARRLASSARRATRGEEHVYRRQGR